MFPIVHHFFNVQLNPQLQPLLVYGGLFPDLASGMGMSRNDAHQMGPDFYQWCLAHREQYPQGPWLARGVICHGSLPGGLDYYADEHWPGGRKGWCFQQGEQWMDQIERATGLPHDLVWWKSHNFVEMGLELVLNHQQPELAPGILAALADEAASAEAAAILQAYTGLKADVITATFAKTPNIFAIDPLNPMELARKQAISFVKRHDVHGSDVPAMADILERIALSLEEIYPPFLRTVME